MNRKKLMHVGIAIVIFVLLKLLIPEINGLTPSGVNVIATTVVTVYMWTTIGLDWVSMLSIALLAMSGAITPNDMYAASFGNWLTPFMLIGMIINGALAECGVTERIIHWFMTRKWLEGRPWCFVVTYLFAFYFSSLFLDCVPASLLFLPMAGELCEQLGYQKGDKLPKVIFAGALVCVLLGFAATPISHIIPIMYIGFISQDIGPVSFLDYMMVGIPYTLAVFVLMIAYFRFVIRPDVSKLKNYSVEEFRKKVRPLSKKGKITLATYLVVIFFWLLPDLGRTILPEIAAFVGDAGYVVAPVIGVTVLCLVQVDGEPVINFPKMLSKVNWTVIILVAAMNSIGACITSENAGITTFLSATFGPILTSASTWFVIVAVVTVWSVMQTNFMSCLVTGQMIYAIIVPLVLATPQLGVHAASIAMLIGVTCNFGVMTPPASGPAAVFITTEWYTAKDALKYGFGMAIIWIITGIFICYPLGVAFL